MPIMSGRSIRPRHGAIGNNCGHLNQRSHCALRLVLRHWQLLPGQPPTSRKQYNNRIQARSKTTCSTTKTKASGV